jgi:predicted ribosomally synthesized peptide with nif11-like leader
MAMSVEDLKKFGQMCNEKEEVRTKAKAIGIDNIDAQIAYAKELGLHFTQEDLVALAKESGLAKSDELSEEDLEKVAGGVVTVTVGAVLGLAAACAVAVAGAVGAGAAVVTAKAW